MSRFRPRSPTSRSPAGAARSTATSTPPAATGWSSSPRRRSSRAAGRSALVHLDEVREGVGDLLGRLVATQVAFEESGQRVAPDRAADRESNVAIDAGATGEPALDPAALSAAPEDHADHLIASAGAALSDDPLTGVAPLEALDLPHRGLDAGVLELGDRANHEPGAQLGVVALRVPAHGGELLILRRHQELEQKAPPMLGEPGRERHQTGRLAAVDLGIAVRVVAHEDLDEVGVEALDVVAELLPVLEVELRLTALLDRHRELHARFLDSVGNPLRSPELLVDQAARGARMR